MPFSRFVSRTKTPDYPAMKKTWPFVLSALFLATTACTHQQTEEDLSATIALKPERVSGVAAQIRKPQPQRVLSQEQSSLLTDRLREGMGFSQEVDPSHFKSNLEWHRKNPGSLPVLLARGEPYLHYIAEELSKAGLPSELALLPIIESGFDPFAYSSGHASGLWQFIPATGERFGLTRDWWWAGRRDVIDSTTAAIAYMQYLNGLFDGDWLLTLAAYNSGEGTVSRAVARNRAANKPTDFWSLNLPRQTRNYIPALLALAEVLRNPDSYGVALPEIIDEPYFEVVELEGAINLRTAAELAGIEQDELLQLNPAVRRGALSPEGPHRLLVPVQSRDLFIDSLASLPRSDWMPVAFHTVQRGDTLSQIAQQYGVQVSSLQSINGLNGTTIRVGQRLQVPGAATLELDRAIAEASQPRQYVVKQGDSLWSIARRNNVNLGELARWNRLDSNSTLRPGQTLTLASAGSAVTQTDSRQVNYRIRQGDSLSRIAQQFNLSVRDIIRWNRLERDSILRPGQGLVLFVN